MSRMSEILLEIEELLLAGHMSNEKIASTLNVPIEWVNSSEESLIGSGDYYDESMDGDAATALASAGWGTDEDYGTDHAF